MLARTLLSTFLVTCFAPHVLAQATTWTVDDDGPADFSSIQAAVDAALDGDLVFVRDGFYAAFTVDGKALAVQGQGVVRCTSPIFTSGVPAVSIVNLSASQEVTLRNVFGVTLGAEDIDLALRIANCDGPVLVEECAFLNLNGRSVQVFSCASVVLRGCRIDAGNSIWVSAIPGYLARTGVLVQSSTLEVHDCVVFGSRGVDALATFFGVRPPAPGGSGIGVANSQLLVVGSEVTGGHGGAGTSTQCFVGGDGGDAIASSGSSTIVLRDVFTLAGPGGLGSCGNADGVAGVELDVFPGELTQLPGAARAHTTSSPVTEGTAVVVSFVGSPGDLVLLLVGPEAAPRLALPQVATALHVAPPFTFASLGTTGPGGELQLSLPVPLLPPGAPYARFVSQTVVVSSQGALVATAPATTVLLPVGL